MKNWLLEFCLTCKENKSQTPIVEDAPGDDVNVREAVQNYREEQKGPSPAKCECGTVLVPRYSREHANGVPVRVSV